MVGEFDRSEKVMERLALAASLYEFAQRGQLRFGERTLELEIKLDSIFSQRMSDEVLGVQPGTFNRALLEVGGGRLQNFKDGHRARRLWASRSAKRGAEIALLMNSASMPPPCLPKGGVYIAIFHDSLGQGGILESLLEVCVLQG